MAAIVFAILWAISETVKKKQEQQSDSTSICSLTTFNNPL